MADGASFDCFLSHNSKDKPAARALASGLRARRLRPWFDEDELPPGTRAQDALQRGIRCSRSVAVLIGPHGTGPWQEEEVQAALDLAARRQLPVFAVLLPRLEDSANLSLFLANRTWVDLRQGMDDRDALDRLVWGITGVRPNRDDTGRDGPTPVAPVRVATTAQGAARRDPTPARAERAPEPSDDYLVEPHERLAKVLDHLEQLAPILELIERPAPQIAPQISMVRFDACRHDWPSYLADHVRLHPWPQTGTERPPATALQLIGSGREAFWKALIRAAPGADEARDEANLHTKVRNWINDAPQQVFYCSIAIGRTGRHLPRIIDSAREALTRLGPRTRVLVLFGCEYSDGWRGRWERLWWPPYARLRLSRTERCRRIPASRHLDRTDIDPWCAGFPPPVHKNYDLETLSGELLRLFTLNPRITYEQARAYLVDGGALGRAYRVSPHGWRAE